jgi:hypothetical protein
MRSCANAEHPEAMATELEPPNFFKVISLPRISNPEGSPFESNHIQDLLNHWPQSGSGVQVKYTANEAIEQFKRSGFSPTTFGHELVHRIQEAVLQRYGRTREFYRPVWVDNKQEQIKELHNYSDVVYLGAGRAAFVPCPEAITLQALAERIPNSLRDQLFIRAM